MEKLYIDSLKQSNRVASAFYIPQEEIYEKAALSKHSSIFTAELVVVNQAIAPLFLQIPNLWGLP